MASLFGNDTITVPCPECEHPAEIRVASLKSNPRLTCERCASDIELDSAGLVERLKDVDRAIEALQRPIARLRGRL